MNLSTKIRRQCDRERIKIIDGHDHYGKNITAYVDNIKVYIIWYEPERMLIYQNKLKSSDIKFIRLVNIAINQILDMAEEKIMLYPKSTKEEKKYE